MCGLLMVSPLDYPLPLNMDLFMDAMLSAFRALVLKVIPDFFAPKKREDLYGPPPAALKQVSVFVCNELPES